MNKEQLALETRQAIRYFLRTLTNEAEMLKVASVYPPYKVGTEYATGDVFKYGENNVGDAQLYKVLQPHTSAEEWTPDTATSLYKPVGVTSDGYAEWVQPLGASDAYNSGDIVSHNGTLYISDIDANVWEPGVYGWSEYTE